MAYSKVIKGKGQGKQPHKKPREAPRAPSPAGALGVGLVAAVCIVFEFLSTLVL